MQRPEQYMIILSCCHGSDLFQHIPCQSKYPGQIFFFPGSDCDWQVFTVTERIALLLVESLGNNNLALPKVTQVSTPAYFPHFPWAENDNDCSFMWYSDLEKAHILKQKYSYQNKEILQQKLIKIIIVDGIQTLVIFLILIVVNEKQKCVLEKHL